MIGGKLKEAIILRKIKAAELCKRTGISAAKLLEYLLGETELDNTTLMKLANALQVNELWLEGKEAPMEISGYSKREKKLTVLEAAAILGKSQQFIRIGLQRGILPFGSAVKIGTKYSYYISPSALKKYVSKGIL